MTRVIPGPRPTLLFIDYSVPLYDQFAGSRTNFMYLKLLLELGLEIKFLSRDFKRVEPYSSELNQLGIETLDGEWFAANWEQWLLDNGQGIDYVFINKPEPASMFLPAIRRLTNAAIIYQCHDLHYLRLRRKAELDGDQALMEESFAQEKQEAFIFSSSDVVLTFSHNEELLIKEKFPHKPVFTVPLFFFDHDAVVSAHDSDDSAAFSDRKGLLFVGACAHTPNLDAIKWFCEEIFPLIAVQLPAIELNIVGAEPPRQIMALDSESIHVLGKVSDAQLQQLYANSKLAVVPLRFGAGVKGKVIESLYQGVPLVSTGVGLEGIKNIENLISAHDRPDDFAEAVLALYNDNQRLLALSEQGRQFVRKNFTADKTAQLMRQILEVSRQQAADRAAEISSAATSHRSAPRLIAFYLPQYHPIAENNEWWGEGFTEWHNVRAAEPLFAGHYQPHVPADLGYYDLREARTRIAQAELARQYGIEGFCYYHYWFNGKRLLEQPLQDLLASGKPDFPFCLCWANENWTRRWDGEDQQILMQQVYSEADDREHIRSLLPVFEDKRYIRVNGKPLFMVYRTQDMPDPERTARAWREEARNAGIGELYLCRVEGKFNDDPRDIGFDAATEFAPDWWNKGPQLKPDSALLPSADPGLKKVCANNYVHSYQSMADTMMAKSNPAYKWFRCVTPSWDNRARRKNGANIFVGSSPDKYKAWLRRAIENTNARLLGEERIVFLNAWNEWAEGCHLEPDEKYGHAWLEATCEAARESQQALSSNRAGASEEVRIGRLQSELINYKFRISELEGQVALRDQEIKDMLASTSWRVSAPVRWGKQLLLNIKRRLSA